MHLTYNAPPSHPKAVGSLREGWAHHPLRTEGNRTPQQLWITGLNRNPGYAAVI